MDERKRKKKTKQKGNFGFSKAAVWVPSGEQSRGGNADVSFWLRPALSFITVCCSCLFLHSSDFAVLKFPFNRSLCDLWIVAIMDGWAFFFWQDLPTPVFFFFFLCWSWVIAKGLFFQAAWCSPDDSNKFLAGAAPLSLRNDKGERGGCPPGVVRGRRRSPPPCGTVFPWRRTHLAQIATGGSRELKRSRCLIALFMTAFPIETTRRILHHC